MARKVSRAKQAELKSITAHRALRQRVEDIIAGATGMVVPDSHSLTELLGTPELARIVDGVAVAFAPNGRDDKGEVVEIHSWQWAEWGTVDQLVDWIEGLGLQA